LKIGAAENSSKVAQNEIHAELFQNRRVVPIRRRQN
jgi:hypothetical protein